MNRLASGISGLWKKVFRRLDRPQGVYKCWFGKFSSGVAWLALSAAVLCPPHGTGFSICWFQGLTGLPCFTCGLTRSLSCAVRGMFFESLQYHPLGLFFLALFTLTAVQGLLPKEFRNRIAEYMQARAVIFNSLFLAFVTSLIGYGTVRALVHLTFPS